MSENKGLKNSQRILLAVILTAASILFACVCAITSITFINVQNPFAAIISHLPFLLLAVLTGVLSAMIVGKNVLFTALIPCILAVPYIPGSYECAFAVVLSSLSVFVCSRVLYEMYSKGAKSSHICPVLSFSAIVSEVLICILPMLIGASSAGKKLSTVLFERLGGIIDESVSYITYMFEMASTMYPGLENALTGAEINLLRASMSMSVSLMPAIITCILFFAFLLCIVILDVFNRRTNSFPERKYGIYSVDRPVYIIFNIITTVYILTFFFGSGLSGFLVGLMSALMFIFPHFALLAYRRLYYLLLKPCGEFFAIIIILAITGLGFVFSLQLLFWVLVFFGTSEYRAQEFAMLNGMNDK